MWRKREKAKDDGSGWIWKKKPWLSRKQVVMIAYICNKNVKLVWDFGVKIRREGIKRGHIRGKDVACCMHEGPHEPFDDCLGEQGSGHSLS